MRKVGWVERQVRRADRFQQRHAVLAVPCALEGNSVALVIGIAGTVYGSLGVGFAAQNAMNTASFTEAAGEDPLAGRQ